MFGDTTTDLSLKDNVWSNEKKACKVVPYAMDSNFIWNYYFSINPTAKEYVTNFLKPQINNESKDKLVSEFHERLRTGKTYMYMSVDFDKIQKNEVS